MDAALSSLMRLLPDLAVSRLSPPLLVSLVEALPQLPAQIIDLRALLPGVQSRNVGGGGSAARLVTWECVGQADVAAQYYE